MWSLSRDTQVRIGSISTNTSNEKNCQEWPPGVLKNTGKTPGERDTDTSLDPVREITVNPIDLYVVRSGVWINIKFVKIASYRRSSVVSLCLSVGWSRS